MAVTGAPTKEVCEAEGKQEDEKDEKDEDEDDEDADEENADEENETAARLAEEEESCWRYGVESGA